MRTTRRLLVLALALALPLAMTATASGAPDCSPGGKHEDKPVCANGEDPPPEENLNLNCEDLGWANNPGDRTLSISRADGEDCEDIDAVANGTIFEFTFDVEPDGVVIESPWMLRIRNSVPGDGCSGLWTYSDETGEILIEGLAPTGINPRVVGDGYTATLVVNEVRDPITGDCTTEGIGSNWADDDPEHWVVNLGRSAGKPLRSGQSITVSWTTTTP